MKKVLAVVLLVVFALGIAATTVLAADPVAPVINQVKSLKQKWVEITLLLGDLNGYLFEIQNHLEEASGADESTKLAALNHIRSARTIKDLFIINVVIPEISGWIDDIGSTQTPGTEMGELADSIDDLEDRFCPSGCLPNFPGYSRVFARIRLKMTTIDTIFEDFFAELDEDLTAALGTADAADTSGETCLDPTDGSTPLDQDDRTDPETLNECIDLAELFLTGADPDFGPDDFANADLALERAGTQLIPDMIEPMKRLLLRKLRQVQIELTSIERELKRLQRVKIKRRPAEEITQVQSASLAGGVVALQTLPSLKDVLDEIKGLRILTKDAEFYLHDIDDELDFILDLLAQAKAEIETGATASEVKTLIDLAIEKKELTLLVDLFSLEETIDEMIRQKAALEVKIRALCNAGKIKNPKSCFRILDELAQINAKLAFVKRVIAFISDKLDNGRPDGFPPCGTTDPCDDVDDWLLDAMNELETAGDDYDAQQIIVDIINAMDLIHEAMAKKDCILLGLSCPVESELRGFKGLVKSILTELRFVEKLVRKEVRPIIQPRPRSGELEPLAVQAIEATTRELRVLGTGIAGFTVQVYGLNGQLVVTREVEGSGALRLEELRAGNGAPLANGVYLYVVQVRGYDGQVIQSQINKLVILR
jgi:hypothetical protein